MFDGPDHDDYLRTTASIRLAFGGSPKLLAEFDRARPARTATSEAASSYLMMNPHPWSPEEQDSTAFDHLVDHVGPDAWRMRAVDDLLFGNSVHVLPVGGSCAIETWGMRTIERHRQQEPSGLSTVAEQLLAMAPTFTHATGALLTGAMHGVHFIEDGLWASRLNEWGVSGASEKVIAAYNRIHGAVERRARLINPGSVLAAMSFDELDLRGGPIDRWFADMGLPNDPSFGVAEVLYTYCGPEMRNIVARRLIASGHIWGSDATHVVRLKQVDHNDWDSTMDHESKGLVLCGAQPPQDASYPTQAGIAIAQWVRRNRHTNTSRVAGFYDTPYSWGPLHMVPKLPSSGSSIDAQIASPARLWAGNIDEHLLFLQSALEVQDAHASAEAISLGTQIKQRRAKTNGALARATAMRDRKQSQLREFVDAEAIYASLQRGERPQVPSDDVTLAFIKHRIDRTLASFEGRSLTDLDVQDRDQLTALREDLQGNGPMRLDLWKQTIDHFEEDRLTAIRLTQEALQRVLEEIQKEEVELREVDVLIERTRTAPPPVTMGLYPLHTNLFVCYATQFLFDPDFREFLHLVAQVEGSKEAKPSKHNEVRRLCGMIYPKLEAYLRYIMLGGDYPWQMRQTRVL